MEFQAAGVQGVFGQRSRTQGLDLGGAVWGQGLDLEVLVSPFQPGVFCDSMILFLEPF